MKNLIGYVFVVSDFFYIFHFSGALVGGNVTGLFLDSDCEVTFFIAAMLMFICALCTFAIPNIFSKHIKET